MILMCPLSNRTGGMKASKALIVAGPIALLYLITSVLVVINGFVWLPSMLSLWYDVEAVLYWPFRLYFDLAFDLLSDANIPYWAYALVTRLPFLVIPLLILTGLARRVVRGEEAT